jgi:hypothetical protein
MKKYEAGIISRGHAGERRAARILGQSVYDPLDPMLQERFVEVDQAAGPAVGEPQVRLELLLEYGCKPYDRLDLDHHLAVHKPAIQSMGCIFAAALRLTANAA